MIKLGILGLNEGNGHPYSYSAMFNGFDEKALQELCPFHLIKEYLPRDHRNEFFIPGAKVTHIWTQDRQLSENVSKVALIPHIVDHYTDLIGKVDAVIIARDDPWNHLEMAAPFLKTKLPLFIDKQLTSTKEDMDALLGLVTPDYPLMACSPMRYSRCLEDFLRLNNPEDFRSLHGISRVSWMRYGHHLLEAVVPIWGSDIEYVQSLSSAEKHDIIQLRYVSGLNVIMEFIEKVSLPIELRMFSENQPPVHLPFSDFFYGFHKMMKTFLHMVETGNKNIELSEIISIAKIVLAGDISKQNDGVRIHPETLKKL
jgi:hypothetical protein